MFSAGFLQVWRAMPQRDMQDKYILCHIYMHKLLYGSVLTCNVGLTVVGSVAWTSGRRLRCHVTQGFLAPLLEIMKPAVLRSLVLSMSAVFIEEIWTL